MDSVIYCSGRQSGHWPCTENCQIYWQLNLTNNSSRAPTKDFIVNKSQALADNNYDSRHSMKLAQVDEVTWWCWDFSPKLTKTSNKWPMNALSRFCQVHVIKLNTVNDNHFLKCSCGYYCRVGIPFVCQLECVDGMTLNMFHIRHWKFYDAH